MIYLSYYRCEQNIFGLSGAGVTLENPLYLLASLSFEVCLYKVVRCFYWVSMSRTTLSVNSTYIPGR